LAITGVRLLIYRSGNAPAAGRGGIRDLARQGDDHRQPLWRVVIRRGNGWSSPQMLQRYGGSARGARARRHHDLIMRN